MGSITADPPKPWIETPLIPSLELSKKAGCNIYLKLDLLQPSGSFKSRGVGNLMSLALARHPRPGTVHYFSSSGGNAGLACATTAATLGRPATICVPTTTTPFMVGKIRGLGAQVIQAGENWAAADKYLRGNLLDEDRGGVYVPPFDHPDIWAGARSVVEEIHRQMDGASGRCATPVDAIVCSVGGGGLLCGIMEGITRLKWPGGQRPRVLAMETIGAEGLHLSMKAGKVVTLAEITSLATSLGCTRIADAAFEWAMQGGVVSGTVTDREAVEASVWFADDARLCVEAACGAAISPVYTGELRRLLGEGMSDEEWGGKNVVLEVCGGSNTGFAQLQEYVRKVGL
ncbi:hypothetical protein MKZ38_008963 [Zalerion maritima]|uniref:L-serine ammonia-lyase n=1 Tax=Zalerion maritima TaxID=339359 RepID=A0AAD5RTW8_9PEZI|nr:hypothetical protein MKZ38_008963 [Zalerion maritima]